MSKREIVISGTRIDDDSDAYVVAEIGANHMGNLQTCKELFTLAADCGASAVKLQKRDNRTLYTSELFEQIYDNRNSFGRTYGEHREFLEFDEAQYRELIAHAAEIGVTFINTAFDIRSADFLENLDMPAYKIASGDLTTTPLLRHVAGFGKPMIVSTGGGSMADIERAYETIYPINRQLCFLQCTAAYPAEPEHLNLRVIEKLRQRFPDLVIGLSDHQNGIAMSTAAYVLGARVIEKHFTRNRSWKGSDQSFSLEPIGLTKMIRDLRRTRQALGDGFKRAQPDEAAPLRKMAKSPVATRELPAGHVLTEDDIALKSPADGLPAHRVDELIGCRLSRPMAADEAFAVEDLGGRRSVPSREWAKV